MIIENGGTPAGTYVLYLFQQLLKTTSIGVEFIVRRSNYDRERPLAELDCEQGGSRCGTNAADSGEGDDVGRLHCWICQCTGD